MYSVEADNLRKHYGSNEALRGVSFHVGEGEIFGIIGPDGAGKTSIFRILTTLILPDGGEARVLGLDVVRDYHEIRNKVGYMPGRFSLYQDLSVEENIRFFATLFGTTLEENYDLVKDIYSYLEPFKKRKAGALSGGMKQKLALSCALIHKPDVLFLDEPTTGVDPVSRKEFWNMLTRLKQQGLSIVVSTPYMDEATLCDRIALIQKGRFLDTDTPSGIISKFTLPLLAVSGPQMPSLLRDIRRIPQVFSCFAFGDTHHVVMRTDGLSDEALTDTLSTALHAQGHSDFSIQRISPNIEDCYMYLDTLEEHS
ncbi:MAG TPA: ABC transporter ATP-binding protein [Candidatus Coprenecus stercoravium]|uniref:ABC transporter ATP-binding protein n=1 Tax=Candidatus Coprenecus stercoravium TaxID=2840735 RepID=A0A9D2KA86_9BACT|nr:ABC transporter ATP-binding protein [Candidatus Coprenecus stercoravium]